MKKYQINIFKIYLLILIVFFSCRKNGAEKFDFDGNWRAIDYIALQGGGEIPDKEDSLLKSKTCLSSIVSISNNSYKLVNNVDCYFVNCDNSNFVQIDSLSLNLSSKEYIPYPGYEVVFFGFMSKEFLVFLNTNKNDVAFFDTGCYCENGDYTMKIIIIDQMKIGMFSGANLTILERL
jgi:hypothetical protein